MILGLWRKRRGPTFKQRVADFWTWYQASAQRFYETIEQDRGDALAEEVGEFMDRTLPGMCWVFGPAEEGHSFTVTGAGERPKQLLAEVWRRQAPAIPHWTFHASRQPSSPDALQGVAIGWADHQSIDTQNLLLKTEVDEEEKRVDVVGWHPAFEDLPEEHRYQVLFLLLDEALGEFGVEQWIGQIDIAPVEAGEGVRPLAELPMFIQQVHHYHRWEKTNPLEEISVYQIREPHRGRRGDTIVGSTRIPQLMFEFLESGRLDQDALSQLGAELVYVRIEGSVFPPGKEAEVRGEIEDMLEDSLRAELAGEVLGGALGSQYAYIDLLLLDGDHSRHLVEETLKSMQLADYCKLESFS